jgi:O-antigen biosynthesis protein
MGVASRESEVQVRPRARIATAPRVQERVAVDGRYLTVGGAPFRVRGVTYGSFRARHDGALFPPSERVEADFAAIAEAGLNVVRVYTTPPQDVFELADAAGLRLLVGVHYDDWRYEPTPGRRAGRRVLDAGRRAIETAVESCAGHPGVMAISVGNEVPPDVVRVHGIGHVESVLSRLVEDVHEADPDLLATYTSYPSTEYLRVEGQDFASFNVFLEEPEQLRSYLARLQVVVGERPLVLTELGLAAGLHGGEAQADSLAWQLLTVDEAGCAGAIVFSWTDEWAVGGRPVEGWGFGLTDEERRPKPALDVVRGWSRLGVADARKTWPSVSVVVCAYNAAATIEECLGSLTDLDYPDYEVIVCDDGSTDGTADLAERYPCRILQLGHQGLSAARNSGIAAATGEIVAFLDSDAACHPDWLFRLALAFEGEGVAAAGGPNLPVADAGFVERAVAASPGGPVEVLLSDERAEHVPGCNMAFRRDALEEIGGFDPVYRTAGDDVDVCWKLLERGHQIAFAPTAQVRHHRRSTVSGYLRQQRSYGRAERLLAQRWRHRMNRIGMARWSGSLYGGPRILPSLLRPVVYHGHMGFAPFQGVVREPHQGALTWTAALLPLSVPLALLGLLAPLSLWWLAAPALALLVVAVYGLAIAAAVEPERDEERPFTFRALVGALHVAQPLVRAWGRLRTPPSHPAPRRRESWLGDRADWLTRLQNELVRRRCRVRSGRADADYDLVVSVGSFVSCRVTTAVVWGWTPLHRAVYGLRTGGWAALAAVAVLTIAAPGWAAGALALLTGWVVVELVVLRRLVRSSLAETTRGAAGEGAVEGRVPTSPVPETDR